MPQCAGYASSGSTARSSRMWLTQVPAVSSALESRILRCICSNFSQSGCRWRRIGGRAAGSAEIRSRYRTVYQPD
jgi:hypothetical protein